jgi:hypothetical protein
MAVERHFNSGDIESIISRLKDVMAVSVVEGPDGELCEIHVLADSSRPPKQVVRDIESALMARLGYHVDHKIVSVAQVDSVAQKSEVSRLRLSDVSISLNGSSSEVTVRLQKDGAVYCGTASGGGTPSGQVKMIANATLQAIAESGIRSGSVSLEDATEIAVGNKRLAVVLVGFNGNRGDEVLTGCALVRQDIWKGVVNATLDAVNRRLTAAHL